MKGKRCPSSSYLSENYSQNLRIFISSNRDSKISANGEFYQTKTPLLRGSGVLLEVKG
jgi:hypothetical protein